MKIRGRNSQIYNHVCLSTVKGRSKVVPVLN